MPALFITGTDTHVGKTFVSVGLATVYNALGYSVCVYKPVQTGSTCIETPEDPAVIQEYVPEVATYCSYNFLPPVTPWVADVENRIDPQKLKSDFQRLQAQYDMVLVEGAGGVRVPMTQTFDMRDLMGLLNIPVLVVARQNLGTINHTLLTIEALQSKGIGILGVVVSGYQPELGDLAIQSLPAVFKSWLPVPWVEYLPFIESKQSDEITQAFGSLVERLPIQVLESI